MKRWEYCVAYHISTYATIEYYLPGQKIHGKNIETAVKSLGLEGWELVSVWNGVWYFKRELVQ